MGQKRITYRYRLNDNYKGSILNLERIDLTKNFRDFSSYQNALEHHIKTKTNPEGIVDYEEYDVYGVQKIHSSEEYFNKKIEKVYSRDSLSTMARPALDDVARALDISPINKRAPFLIDLIVKKQELFKLELAAIEAGPEEEISVVQLSLEKDKEGEISIVEEKAEMSSDIISAIQKDFPEASIKVEAEVTDTKKDDKDMEEASKPEIEKDLDKEDIKEVVKKKKSKKDKK